MKSEKIRDSARDENCALRISPECQDGETVVFCHLNTPFKGWGMKSPDLFGVYGCYWCHQILDSSRCSDTDKLRALIETQKKLLDKGLIDVL